MKNPESFAGYLLCALVGAAVLLAKVLIDGHPFG
jgi:hypothetical protein